MWGQQHPVLADRLSLVSDRVKGLLILLVVADHNDWFRQLAPWIFEPLTFHVIGFFFLVFSRGPMRWSSGFVADRIARYLVPFWWALGAASFSYGLVLRGGLNPVDGVMHFVLAALVGGATVVKASSGLLLLWFLPCLFGLACLLAFYDSLASRWARHGVQGLAIAAHVLLPFYTRPWMQWLPFGIVIAADVFLLGLLWRQFIKRHWPDSLGVVAIIVFIASYSLMIQRGAHIEIGTLEISEMKSPWVLLLNDVIALSAMCSVIWLVEHVKAIRWLEGIGRNSLLVYLAHPVFYLVLSKLWISPVDAGLTRSMLGLHACVTTAIVIGLAYGIALVISSSPFLSAWITPRSWRDWAPVRVLRVKVLAGPNKQQRGADIL